MSSIFSPLLHCNRGLCNISKNKVKSSVSLLTTDGIIEVKFNKEYFSMFDKRISQKDAKGVKHTIQESWFNRGSMIVVQGLKNDDIFRAKNYSSSGGHQLYHIESIEKNGDLILVHERAKGIEEEEE